MSKKIVSAIAVIGISMILGSSVYAAPLKPKGYGGGPGCPHQEDEDNSGKGSSNKGKGSDDKKKDKKCDDDSDNDHETKPTKPEIDKLKKVIEAWLKSFRNNN